VVGGEDLLTPLLSYFPSSPMYTSFLRTPFLSAFRIEIVVDNDKSLQHHELRLVTPFFSHGFQLDSVVARFPGFN